MKVESAGQTNIKSIETMRLGIYHYSLSLSIQVTPSNLAQNNHEITKLGGMKKIQKNHRQGKQKMKNGSCCSKSHTQVYVVDKK